MAIWWDKHRAQDRGLIWLRTLLQQAARQVDDAGQPFAAAVAAVAAA